MLLKSISPFVRQVVTGSVGTKTPDDVFFELQTVDCRLFYITSGKGKIIIENEHHTLTAGCIILFQAGVKYTWCPETNSSLEYIAINFDYTHAASHVTKTFHPIHSSVFSPKDIIETVHFSDAVILNAPIVLRRSITKESQFHGLATEYMIDGPYSDELLSSMLKTIIISIVKELDTSPKNLPNTGALLTRRIIQYIQKNYRYNISYDALAEEFHLNSIYMNRVFKKNRGMSIHAFLIQYRINTAMELLRSSSISVKEISSMVGFSDLPHFLKTFKRITKTTPSLYRTSVDN